MNEELNNLSGLLRARATKQLEKEVGGLCSGLIKLVVSSQVPSVYVTIGSKSFYVTDVMQELNRAIVRAVAPARGDAAIKEFLAAVDSMKQTIDDLQNRQDN